MKNTIFTIIIVFIIAGCAAKEKLEEMPVTQVAPQRLEVKGPPMEQLPLSQVVEEVKEREKLYSLSVKNMDVRNVLFIFSTELPEYNVVVDPDVEGIVTVDFKELPLDKALAFILEPLNLEYVIDEKVLRISKPRLETRTFEFVYSTSTRTARGALMAVTGGGGKEISGDEEGGGEEVTTAASFGSVETEDIINVWDELEAGIKDLMSDDGKLSTNKRVGYITVTDYRANLKGIEDLINFFKAVVKKQILIRAKILEITLTESSEFGIDWNVVLTRLSILGGKRGKIAGSLGTTARPTAFTQPFAPSTDRSKAPNSVAQAINLFQFGITHKNFDLIVRALETQGKVAVLSAPEVSTLNGQKAIIRSVRDDVVFQSSASISGSTTTVSTTADPFTFGVYLDVTPHVDLEGMITMAIHPSVSSLVRKETFGDPEKGGAASKPIIDTRETDTIVTVMDGETVIIAGLMQDKVKEDISKVPLFGDIPYIGKVFRREIKSSEKSELVILLSPTIVGPRARDFGIARKKYRTLRRQFPR